MRKVTYSMGVSLDGYIVGPDGGFNWAAPDDEVFRFVTDEIRERRRPPDGAAAVRDDAVLGDRRRRTRRSTTRCASGPRCGSRCRRWCSPPR